MVELYESLTKIIIASFAFARHLSDFFEPLKAYDREFKLYLFIFIMKDTKPTQILVEPVAM